MRHVIMTAKQRYKLKNKDKIAAWSKIYYKRNKHRYFVHHLKYRYGLTPEDYANLLERCKNKCEICGKKLTKKANPCVDHCHKTGKVRGMLCKYCNIHLDWFEKHEREAKQYLRKKV